MLTVELPNNFVAERTYSAEVLLSEILGLKYNLVFSDRADCLIRYGEHSLSIASSFWPYDNSEYGFLTIRRIPEIVTELSADVLGAPMVSIYGDASCSWQTVGGAQSVKCGIDIFASAFFMLARWEENVITARDSHGRFPLESSLAWKHGFHHRPVVNEYAAFIRLFLQKAGFPLPAKREAQFISTHDVDHLFKWNTTGAWFRTLMGDIFKRRSLSLVFANVGFFLRSPFSKHSDPYNTFSKLLKDGHKAGAKSIFYFLMNQNNIEQLTVHSKWLFRKIQSQGGTIGIHADYNSFLPNGSLYKEKNHLEQILGNAVIESRQHYLRFALPETWNMLNKRGISVDSSLYYPEAPGFRTGCCNEYSCFDIFHRTQLPLRERTLCFMDRSLFYEKWQTRGAEQYIMDLIHQVEKHGGDFVMLWHNSSFDYAEWRSHTHIYDMVIQHFAKKQLSK